MNFARSATALLMGLCCTLAWAQDDESGREHTYFSVLGSYLFDVDQDRNLGTTEIDDGGGVVYIFGHQWASGLGWEVPLFAEAYETGTDQGTDFYRGGLGLDLTYTLGKRQGLSAFGLIGLGASYNDVYPDNLDDWSYYGNAGIGLVTEELSRHGLKLRAEARYIYDAFDMDVADGFSDMRASIGIEFALGGDPEVRTETVELIKIVEVERNITADDDNDGVINERDKCPNTPPGTRVGGDGCELSDVVTLEGVTFEFDRDRLRPDAKTILNEAAKVLNRYPDMVVEIAGHTDSLGSDTYNQQLSQRRAQAVLNYLVSIGVDGSRMTAAGYGESEPRAGNDSEEGRELNRRVEMRILN